MIFLTNRIHVTVSSRMRHLYVILAAVLIPVAARAQELTVEELWRTNGDPETANFFVGISGMAEAADGSIWVSDARSDVVFAIDAALSIRLVARTGEGPGEVTGPTRIARTPSGGLAIYDPSAFTIEVFGPDGSFERRVRLEMRVYNIKGFAALPNGGFILSGGVRAGIIPEGSYGIHHYSAEGETVESWWRIPETQNPRAGTYVAGGPIAALPDGSILFSDAAPHRIFRFSADGSERELIVREPELLEPIGDEFIHTTGSDASRRTTFQWYFPQSRLIARLSSGHLLNVVEFHKSDRTLFQIYDVNGSQVTQTWVDTAYTPWTMTRDGDILATWIDPDTYENYAVRLEIEYTR